MMGLHLNLSGLLSLSLSGAVDLLLLMITLSDLRTRRIPDHYTLLLLFFGMADMVLTGGDGPTASMRVVGFFLISLPILLVCLMKPGGFGGGDIKLMAAAGFYLGALKVWYAAFYAFLTAGLYCLFMLLFGRLKRKDTFALGPFLCLGIFLAGLL